MRIESGNLTDREYIYKGIQYVRDLIKDINIPLNLREVGVKERDIRPMAEYAVNVKRLLRNNPKILTLEDIKKIYKKTY